MRRGPAVTAAIAAVVVAADQAAKVAARAYLAPNRAPVPVVGDLVRLTFTRNTGAAFGMLEGGRAAFIVVSLLAVAVIAGYVIERRPQHPWLVIALGLVAAGAIGNAIDRAFIGWVTDFIQIPFDFPVFNIADSAVVVGVAMLVWWLLFGPGSKGDAPQAATGASGEDAAHADAAPAAPIPPVTSDGGASAIEAEHR